VDLADLAAPPDASRNVDWRRACRHVRGDHDASDHDRVVEQRCRRLGVVGRQVRNGKVSAWCRLSTHELGFVHV
jgi:hypothetical protein